MPEDWGLRKGGRVEGEALEKKGERTGVRLDLLVKIRERFGEKRKMLKSFLKDQEAEGDIDPEMARFVEAWLVTGVMPFEKEGGKFLDEMTEEVNAFLETLEEELPNSEEIHGAKGSDTWYRSSPGKEYFSDPRGRRVPPAPGSDGASGRPTGSYADSYTFGHWTNDDDVED